MPKHSIDNDIEYLKSAQFEQLGGKILHEIYDIKGRLENARFDQTQQKDGDKIARGIDICEMLLKGSRVWKVSYKVMKNREGCYENGGESYFWTEEEAENFITKFKKQNDGWTSDIDEPEEVDLSSAEMD